MATALVAALLQSWVIASAAPAGAAGFEPGPPPRECPADPPYPIDGSNPPWCLTPSRGDVSAAFTMTASPQTVGTDGLVTLTITDRQLAPITWTWPDELSTTEDFTRESYLPDIFGGGKNIWRFSDWPPSRTFGAGNAGRPFDRVGTCGRKQPSCTYRQRSDNSAVGDVMGEAWTSLRNTVTFLDASGNETALRSSAAAVLTVPPARYYVGGFVRDQSGAGLRRTRVVFTDIDTQEVVERFTGTTDPDAGWYVAPLRAGHRYRVAPGGVGDEDLFDPPDAVVTVGSDDVALDLTWQRMAIDVVATELVGGAPVGGAGFTIRPDGGTGGTSTHVVTAPDGVASARVPIGDYVVVPDQPQRFTADSQGVSPTGGPHQTVSFERKPGAAISVTAELDDSDGVVAPGDEFTAKVTYANDGLDDITDFDPRPPSTAGFGSAEFVSRVPDGSPATLLAGGSFSATYTFRAVDPGFTGITFAATGTGPDGDIEGSATLAVDIHAELSVTASVDEAQQVNQPFAVTFRVTNDSPTSTVVDVHPVAPPATGGDADLEQLSGPDPVAALTLGPGARGDFTYTFQAHHVGDGTISAAFHGGPNGSSGVDGSATATIRVVRDLLVVNTITDDADLDLTDGACDTRRETGSQCSLRAAIEEATARTDADAITFDIDGTPSIEPRHELPPVPGDTTIDGTTQAGGWVQLDGTAAQDATAGLRLIGGFSTVKGMVVNSFAHGAGIVAGGIGHHTIVGNRVGTDLTASVAAPNETGIEVAGGEATIVGGEGLAASCAAACNLVSGNTLRGIWVHESTGTAVLGNVVGLAADGTTAIPNAEGVVVRSTARTQLGGPTAVAGHAPGNLVAGNTSSDIELSSAGNDARVRGNLVGIDITGEAAPAATRAEVGIRVDEWFVASDGRGPLIGGPNAGEGNVVTGEFAGVYVGEPTTPALTVPTTLQGNHIGLSRSGTRSLGGRAGVAGVGGIAVIGGETSTPGTGAGNVISGSTTNIFLDQGASIVSGNLIGLQPDGRHGLERRDGQSGVKCIEGVQVRANVISGNVAAEPPPEMGPAPGDLGQGWGLWDCSAAGNLIGTDVTGTTPVPNTVGVKATGRGISTLDDNLISGNQTWGVLVESPAGRSLAVTLRGNKIGTDVTGTRALPNHAGGIRSDGPLVLGGERAGATCVSPCNLISGNGGAGVEAELRTDDPPRYEQFPHIVDIVGNFVGTDVTGTVALPNATGVVVGSGQVGAPGDAIAGTCARRCNLISGNRDAGVVLTQDDLEDEAILAGNAIGTGSDGRPLGNGQVGVGVGSILWTVGGVADEANTIAHNGGPGVFVSTGNGRVLVLTNSIRDNAGLGIERINEGINFVPQLTSAERRADGTIVVRGVRTGQNNVTRIDAYANRTCDPSGFGEGEVWAGAATYVLPDFEVPPRDPFSITLPEPSAAARFVVVTESTPVGTSQFSNCVPLVIQTALRSPAFAVTRTLDVDTAGFTIGDVVAVNPGTATAEFGIYARAGSIVLDRPLRFDHAVGEPVVKASSLPTGSPNLEPWCDPITVSTPFQTSLTGSVACSDEGTVTYARSSAAAHGSAVVNPNGTYSYVPSPGFSGVDSFTFTARDAQGVVSVPARVTITVGSPPPAPTGLTLRVDTVTITSATRWLPSTMAVTGRLTPVAGASYACGEGVRIQVAGQLDETLPAAKFRKVGTRCVYARVTGAAYVDLVTVDLTSGTFVAAGFGRAPAFATVPASTTVGVTIGDDAGAATVATTGRNGIWTYRR